MTQRSSEPNPWVGAAFGRTSVDLARRLSDAYEHELAGDAELGGSRLRSVVTSSWQRALSAGVDPEHNEPPSDSSGEAPLDRWAVHPLHPFVDVVEQMLGSFAYDAGHIVVIADHDGCLLWSMGHPRVLAASESIGFTPGRVWSESAVGTNGVGTALAVDHPVQIFASEHFKRPVHAWVCAGAPIHDPATGQVLGVIDVSSGIRAAHPYSLAMVSATAKMVETLLANQHAVKGERARARFYELVARRRTGARALIDPCGRVVATHPEGWLHGPLVGAGARRWLAPGSSLILDGEPFGDGFLLLGSSTSRPPPAAPELTLTRLDAHRLSATLDGVDVVLSPRRSQLLALLALAPQGRHGAELAAVLYGPGDHDVALRAEVSRLRRQLGGVIATNPYRLLATVAADPAILAQVATPLQR